MISEFEARLADALGSRIPAPFAGHVDVAPGEDSGADVRVILGVTGAEIVEPDLGSRRPEVLPGATTSRRAVRMRCTVSFEMRNGDREQQMKALDAVLYALDAADFRTGGVLSDGSDSGFLIQEMRPSTLAAPLAPDADEAPIVITVTATGLFWPVGVTGETGKIIGEIRFRAGTLPLEIVPAEPLFTAGGAPAVLTIRFATAGLLVKKDSVAALPFGSIAVTLVGPGGKPGKGTLSGGSDGTTAAIRLLPLVNGTATVTYAPPADPVVEELVIAFDDGENGLGIEIGRATLRTRGA